MSCKKRTSLLKKALSEHNVEQVHLSFGHHPQVIQVQKFVTLFVTIVGRYLWYDGSVSGNKGADEDDCFRTGYLRRHLASHES